MAKPAEEATLDWRLFRLWNGWFFTYKTKSSACFCSQVSALNNLGFANATALSSSLPDWSNNGLMLWIKSQFVGVIFFNIKKAFDRVYLPGLLHRLESAGVRGSALQWFRNFLQNRCHGQWLASRFLQLNIYMPVFRKVRSWALFCFCCTWMILLLSPTAMWIFLPMTHQPLLCRTL